MWHDTDKSRPAWKWPVTWIGDCPGTSRKSDSKNFGYRRWVSAPKIAIHFHIPSTTVITSADSDLGAHGEPVYRRSECPAIQSPRTYNHLRIHSISDGYDDFSSAVHSFRHSYVSICNTAWIDNPECKIRFVFRLPLLWLILNYIRTSPGIVSGNPDNINRIQKTCQMRWGVMEIYKVL